MKTLGRVLASLSLAAPMLVVAAHPALAATCNGKTATIVGTAGNDTINGTNGADVIVSLGGDDTITANGGNDTICGGDGNDTIFGNAGDDYIQGDANIDYIDGGNGDDTIYGNTGDDHVIGGDGSNYVDAGGGNDLLDMTSTSTFTSTYRGGDGDDQFKFDAQAAIPYVIYDGNGNDIYYTSTHETANDTLWRCADSNSDFTPWAGTAYGPDASYC